MEITCDLKLLGKNAFICLAFKLVLFPILNLTFLRAVIDDFTLATLS